MTERIAGTVRAFLWGSPGMTLSSTAKNLMKEARPTVVQVLRERKEAFSKENPHSYWELIRALGIQEDL